MTTKQLELREKNYVNAWTTIFSVVMFFISFFTAYFGVGQDLSVAFIKSMFVLFVAHILSKILIFVWKISIPHEQWMFIVHGRPPVDSRSEKRALAIQAAIDKAEADALLAASLIEEESFSPMPEEYDDILSNS